MAVDAAQCEPVSGASFLICIEQWGRVQKYPVTQPRMFLGFPGLK